MWVALSEGSDPTLPFVLGDKMRGNNVLWTIVGVLLALVLLIWLIDELGGKR